MENVTYEQKPGMCTKRYYDSFSDGEILLFVILGCLLFVPALIIEGAISLYGFLAKRFCGKAKC